MDVNEDNGNNENKVTIMFQAMGGQPQAFTVDQGTTLHDFVSPRAPTEDYIILVNTKQVEPEEYVLQDNDVIFANQRRSYG